MYHASANLRGTFECVADITFTNFTFPDFNRVSVLVLKKERSVGYSEINFYNEIEYNFVAILIFPR